MIYILYNPKANNGKPPIESAIQCFGKSDTRLVNIIGLDALDFVSRLSGRDKLVLCGGDGTLSRFANDTYGCDYPCEIYLYKAGTGNDFFRDVEPDQHKEFTLVNTYLKNLPTVEIGGRKQYYINGIGYGIDGKVCEVADRQKQKGRKRINYTLIALRLFFFGYRRPDAVVTVDGEMKLYRRVWMAPAMLGQYYGGGMMAAPGQDRLSGLLTVVVVHKAGKLRALLTFPKIFKGRHVSETDIIEILTGKSVSVEFSAPMALQVDGETVLGVTGYRAETGLAEGKIGLRVEAAGV